MQPVGAILSNFQRSFIAMLVGLLLLGAPATTAAKQQLFETYKQVIVLDPGHGGQESGARGADGTLEKNVTLTLARILTAELAGQYRVVLTRTDDYTVNIDSRTALANHLKADLFISLHTGGSFVHRTAGTTIFFYQDFPRNPTGEASSPGSVGRNPTAPGLWEQLQNRHLEASRLLARLINVRISSLETIPACRIQGAPLAVLQGADMPAVLIEPGYLTNPTAEEKLRDRRFLTNLAAAIHRGIEDFFARKKP
jgi:N-acetylmuramoyl-L-alanine amidase